MHRLLPLAALLLSACGPTVRQCPAPIGPVVEEDCSVYQRRVSALQVEVVGVLGGATVTGSARRQTLRTPSQAFEVLADRLHVMCRDHNTCRTSSADYDRQRQRYDETLLGVGALVDRIEAAQSDKERGRLRQELRRTLGRLTGEAKITRRRIYRSSMPWMGTQISALQPSGDQPQIIGHTFNLDHQFEKGLRGYRPWVRVELWWPSARFASDDALVVDWGDGVRSACPVRGHGNTEGHRSVVCRAPETAVLTGAKVRASLRYRRGTDGSEVPLGTVEGQVLRMDRPDGKPDHYGSGRDHLVARSQLVYRPANYALPAKGERPHIVVVLRLRDHARPTLRCAVDGEDVFGALRVFGRASGQAGSFRDRPRWKKVSAHKSVGVAHPHLEWWRFDWALPFVAYAEPGEDQAWPRAGDWRCRVTLQGHTVRRMHFKIDDQGQVIPKGVAEGPAWPLPTEVVPSPVEEPLP